MAFPHGERSELTLIESAPSGVPSAWMEGPAEPTLPLEVLTTLPMLGRSSTATVLDASSTSTLPIMARAIGSAGEDERGCLGDEVLLEATFDDDDPLQARHLELEVGVVGDGHELGEARSIEEGMVDTGEVDDLKGEWLLVEVVWLA